MMQHWQYNVIVTQTTGTITYSVSDTVKAKDTIVNRKKPPVHVQVMSGQCVKSW